MTDVLSRPTAAPAGAPSEPPGRDASRQPPFELGAGAKVVLSALAAAAGVIHLVMIPAHAADWLPEGIAFAVAGWWQIGLAVVLLLRPGRKAVQIGAVSTVALIAAWVVSRTTGLPVGPGSGVAEPVGFVDLATIGFEAAFVLAAAVGLARPDLGRGRPAVARRAAAVVPVAAVLIATAAIASPSATDHSHGHSAGGGEAAAGDMSAMDHGHGDPAAPADDDKGLSLLANGHQHSHGEVPIDAATQKELSRQLALTHQLVDRYPTVAAATADGYRRAGPFSPALGTHYIKGAGAGAIGDGPITDEQILHPVLIYNGRAPDAPLIGFMYMAYGVQGEPQGFAGPNDHWHSHSKVCITQTAEGIDTPLGADHDATKEQCDTVGGRLLETTGYMVHVWTVAGWENPSGGAFAELNPKITCQDGTYHSIPIEKIGTNSTTCRDEAVLN
jgi:hypothetical protein